jgi:D-alanine-D-alanine ligase
MNITVLFNEPRAGAAADEADVLVQVEAVSAALAAEGHAVERLACGLDLASLAARLDATAPDLVFNLVEGIAGHDRLFAVVPSLLDALGIPYTGSSAEAIFSTTSKLLGKERLLAAGLPTPAVPARWPPPGGDASPAASPFAAGRYILKPVWEHGSVGMEDDMVVEAPSRADLERRLAALGERTGRACFAEAFVEGRELNLSVLAGASGAPEVLPPAEIDFSAYPAGKPRIVGWAAKWDEGSFEYHHTPRRFAFPASDRPLLAELVRLARACWHVFELGGYARVDFRVDAALGPQILEVNTNPCLSPDAGFAAAVAEAGLTYRAAIARVVAAVPMRRAPLVASPP